MRIVGGTHSGRKLSAPKNDNVRPTSDKVRGALFNALESRGVVNGAKVLDAFCGSGALGLEALSRGASKATFWDNDSRSLDLAKENVSMLGEMDKCTFQKRDATKSYEPRQSEEFDLVFVDPPYRKNMIQNLIQSLSAASVLSEGAVFVLEMEKGHDPNAGSSFTVLFDKIYGDTRVMIMKRYTE